MTAVHLLSGCDQVPIKNETFYGSKGPLGAVQFQTLQHGQKNLTKAQWDAMLLKTPMVCGSVSAFTDQKAAIEKLCSVCDCCEYNGATPVNDFFKKIMAVKF